MIGGPARLNKSAETVAQCTQIVLFIYFLMTFPYKTYTKNPEYYKITKRSLSFLYALYFPSITEIRICFNSMITSIRQVEGTV